MIVEPRGDDGSLLKSLPTPGPALDRNYELAVGPKGSRLLGREVRVIDVRPRDIYRYGYRLWLDEETAMPDIAPLSTVIKRNLYCKAQQTRLE